MDFSSINPDGAEQLYLQIRRLVVQAIEKQELLPGQRIPSIATIATQARVSQMTVRHALDALISEGWIYTVPGKGSFVTEESGVVLGMQHLLGWSEEMKMQGAQPATRLIETRLVPAYDSVAQTLDVPLDTLLHRTIRVQYAEGTPLGLDTTYMVADRFPDFADLISADPTSISRILRERYGVHLLRGFQLVEAIGADRDAANLLEVPFGAPVLLVQRTTFTIGDIPVQFVRAIHHSGMVRFRVELSSTLPVRK